MQNEYRRCGAFLALAVEISGSVNSKTVSKVRPAGRSVRKPELRRRTGAMVTPHSHASRRRTVQKLYLTPAQNGTGLQLGQQREV